MTVSSCLESILNL